jgi:hypothetical protein
VGRFDPRRSQRLTKSMIGRVVLISSPKNLSKYGHVDLLLYQRQCYKSRLGESIDEGPECNLSVTSTENIEISRKMLQDRGLTRNILEYLGYIGQGFNSEYLGISRIYRRDLQH